MSTQAVFIDSRVPDIQALIAGASPGARVFVLDPLSDGVQQIADLLAANDLTGLASISIVGHGLPGEIDLGSSVLDDADLAGHASALSTIGSALSSGGDLALYACNTAAGATGQQFIADLSHYAGGVDVAAATHLVGSADLGGSWTLNASTGAPVTAAPFSEQALADFQGTLSLPEVTVTGQSIYRGGGSPVSLIGTLGLSDPGVSNLLGASVQIVGFENGDTLNFTDTAHIHGSYNAATGLLTLNGSDTLADYQTALKSVTYDFAGNGDPAGGAGIATRSIDWQVGDGTSQSPVVFPAFQTIDNDQPTLGLNEFVVANGIFPVHGDPWTDGDGIPLGAVRTLAGNIAWGGTLPADGSKVGISTYTPLFAILGFNYGGDGATTFGLPNLAGRLAVGHETISDAGLGTLSGSDQFSLLASNLPAGSSGSGQPFDNDQPSQPVNYIINVAGNTGGIDIMGEVLPFLGDYAPTGYMFAAGQMLNISDHLALFSVIGTSFGGDGITTFELPNLTGRTIVGASQGFGTYQIGQSFGQDETTLTASNLPLVGGVPVSNEQPSLVMTYLIAVNGLFPSTSNSPQPNEPYIGEIIAYAGYVGAVSRLLDSGNWQVAAGQTLPIDQYDALYQLIGTTYGGDGVQTFKLPDLQGRSVAGTGSDLATGTTTSLGEQSGTTQFSLTQLNTPNAAITSLTIDHTGPTVTAGATAIFSIGGLAATLDTGIAISDPDSGGMLAGATVSIGGIASGDTLNFTNTAAISGTYDPVSGKLTLTGNDTIANYQAALDSVTFTSTTTTTGSRTIDWVVNDGTDNSNQGTSTLNIVVDPVINSVTVGPSPTDLGAGTIVTLTVNFSNLVNVTGIPELQLNDNQVAAYSGGTGTSALTFSYTVQPGDNIGDLQVASLLLSGGTIKDGAGNDADLTNAPTDLHLQVDTIAPVVSSIVKVGSTPNNGNSEAFTVTFSENVTGVDSADFGLATTGTIADTGITVTPVSGSIYTVTVNGVTGDGTLGLNLNNSGTGIIDAAGNALPTGLAGPTYTVDHTPPAVTSITVLGSTANHANSDQFLVVFSEAVTGVAPSDFALTTINTPGGTALSDTGISSITGSGTTYTVTIGGVAGDGTLRLDLSGNSSGITDAAGNGAVAAFTGGDVYAIEHTLPSVSSIHTVDPATNNLNTEHFTVTFANAVNSVDASDFTLVGTNTVSGLISQVSGSGTTWTVTVDNVTGDGMLRLDLNNSGDPITDAFGNTLTAAHTGDQSYAIEHTPPSATAMTVPANGTYVANGDLDFTVTFNEAVFVTGTPRIPITLDTGGTVYATYLSGSGTSTLTFRDVVAPGQQDLTGIVTGTAIDLNGGTVQDAATNNAVLGISAVEPLTAGIHVDAILPAVASVGIPANGTYGTGQDLDFTVDFTKAVNVNTASGTPYIQLTLDTGGTVDAFYLSGSGSPELTFRYVVPSGELDSNGIVVGTDLVLNNGTIQDTLGNNTATALNNVGVTGGVLVDSIPPSVISIHTAGNSVNNLTTEQFTVTFSSAVTGVDGTDFTVIGTNTVLGSISQVSGSGSVWTVTVNNVTGDGTLGLNLNNTGDPITDVFGNTLLAAHAGDQSYTIDHTAPAATSVTAVADNGHSDVGIGHVVTITLATTEAVTVAGTPTLSLDDGGIASYVGGNGTTALTFDYTVAAGDNSADLHVTGYTGAIHDSAGNALSPVTADLGLQIDGNAPLAPALALQSDTGISSTDHITSNPAITVTPAESGGTLLYKADAASGFSTTVPVFATDGSADGPHTVSVEQQDAAGNIGAATSLSFTLDTTAPQVSGITASPGSGGVFTGSTVELTLAFNEAVSLTGTPSLALNDGATATYDPTATAALHDATKFVFDYLVGANDQTPSLAVTGLTANGATVSDLAGNLANLSSVASAFNGLSVNENVVAAYTVGGITRPALELDQTGHIILDAAAASFVAEYGLKLLYIGMPASTPYPPVADTHQDFHLV